MAIDAALYSGSKCYFFKGNRYIRVTRGDTGPGTVDSGYPAKISELGLARRVRLDRDRRRPVLGIEDLLLRGQPVHPGYPRRHRSRNGRSGLSGEDLRTGAGPPDSARTDRRRPVLGSKCYFFDGNRYIRVTRGDTGPGTVTPGYPATISNWGWPGGFGSNGIHAALYSGSKCYFFAGDRYIRVTRGDTGPGTVDPGYPANIANWRWPRGLPVPSAFRRFGSTPRYSPPRPSASPLPSPHARVVRGLGIRSDWSPPRTSTCPS